MKQLTLFTLSILFSSSLAQAGAVPVLHELKGCQGYGFPMMRDVDDLLEKAAKKSAETDAKNKKLSATCGSLAKKENYNDSDAIKTFVGDLDSAATGSVDTVTLLDQAQKAVATLEKGLKAIGGTKKCLESIDKAELWIHSYQIKIKADSNYAKNCLNKGQ